MKYINCDKCGKECPPFNQAEKKGWYLSKKLSVSGIPWDLFCPDCRKNNLNITN